MTEKLVAVDSGMVLMIDPAHLFSEEEWLGEVNPLAESYGGDWPRAVLEILARRTGSDIPGLAAVVETCGDGRFRISQGKGHFVLENACP